MPSARDPRAGRRRQQSLHLRRKACGNAPFADGYRIFHSVLCLGVFVEVLNSDSAVYGGGGVASTRTLIFAQGDFNAHLPAKGTVIFHSVSVISLGFGDVSRLGAKSVNIDLFESVQFGHPDSESTMIRWDTIENGQDSQNDQKQSGRNAH